MLWALLSALLRPRLDSITTNRTNQNSTTQLAQALGLNLTADDPSNEIIVIESQAQDGFIVEPAGPAAVAAAAVAGPSSAGAGGAEGAAAEGPAPPPAAAAEIERLRKRLARATAAAQAADRAREEAEAEKARLAAETARACREAAARTAAEAARAAAGGRLRAPVPAHWAVMTKAEEDGYKLVELPLPGKLQLHCFDIQPHVCPAPTHPPLHPAPPPQPPKPQNPKTLRRPRALCHGGRPRCPHRVRAGLDGSCPPARQGEPRLRPPAVSIACMHLACTSRATPTHMKPHSLYQPPPIYESTRWRSWWPTG
jgi:hypothetical protein